jgi:hypothetical protein
MDGFRSVSLSAGPDRPSDVWLDRECLDRCQTFDSSPGISKRFRSSPVFIRVFSVVAGTRRLARAASALLPAASFEGSLVLAGSHCVAADRPTAVDDCRLALRSLLGTFAGTSSTKLRVYVPPRLERHRRRSVRDVVRCLSASFR